MTIARAGLLPVIALACMLMGAHSAQAQGYSGVLADDGGSSIDTDTAQAPPTIYGTPSSPSGSMAGTGTADNIYDFVGDSAYKGGSAAHREAEEKRLAENAMREKARQAARERDEQRRQNAEEFQKKAQAEQQAHVKMIEEKYGVKINKQPAPY